MILKFIGLKGWYDLERHRADRPNFASMVEVFRRAHAHKTRGFLVLGPETSAYRAKQPPGVEFHLTRTLKDVLGEAAPEVLGFRRALPDDEFTDVNHLNARGKVDFSHLLVKALGRSLVAGGL